MCENSKCLEKESREDEIEATIEEMKEKEYRLSIKQEAEKRLYGKVKAKKKRVPLSKDLRDKVFRKFDNQCMFCEQKQGLHIHHKDHDSSNNAMKNLLLLCGVCHKKIHMKVR
jgi:5-methylcytosine-specific restriction endonuclease McrA